MATSDGEERREIYRALSMESGAPPITTRGAVLGRQDRKAEICMTIFTIRLFCVCRLSGSAYLGFFALSSRSVSQNALFDAKTGGIYLVGAQHSPPSLFRWRPLIGPSSALLGSP
ncbi:hypothetical protein CC78DRAFT_576155 [Lojkania enalia]|uniref:Uncharacterized protein n=1 Tax=Lojkania enalia TaxID=147567 RepID=A0A9P4N6B4_9PLEO|nr:hypothetical protein CC78DRAFT_576155 [Didymosphaeria enalia]